MTEDYNCDKAENIAPNLILTFDEETSTYRYEEVEKFNNNKIIKKIDLRKQMLENM